MTQEDCPLCGGALERKEVPYAYAGVGLGLFEADVCRTCGEAFFTEEAWQRIERLAREKQLWGTGRSVTVGHSGHSLFLRIPREVAAATHLAKGNRVYVQPAGKGRLLVERDTE